MNDLSIIGVEHFNYRLEEDGCHVLVEFEKELVGKISLPNEKSEENTAKSSAEETISLPVGDKFARVYKSDWQEATASLQQLRNSVIEIQPKDRPEARKCIRLFLEQYGLDEEKLFSQGCSQNDSRVTEHAQKALQLLIRAKNVGIFSGKINSCFLGVIESRITQAASSVGEEIFYQLRANDESKLECDAKKVVTAAKNGGDVTEILRAMLRRYGVREELLSIQPPLQPEISAHAERAHLILRKIYRILKSDPSTPLKLVEQVTNLIIYNSSQLGTEVYFDWKLEEERRLGQLVLDVLTCQNLEPFDRIKELLASEQVSLELLKVNDSSIACSSSSVSPMDENYDINLHAGRALLKKALEVMGQKEFDCIQNSVCFDDKAVTEELINLLQEIVEKQDLRTTIRQLMVQYWWKIWSDSDKDIDLNRLEMDLIKSHTPEGLNDLMNAIKYARFFYTEGKGDVCLINGEWEETFGTEGLFSVYEHHQFLKYFDGLKDYGEAILDERKSFLKRLELSDREALIKLNHSLKRWLLNLYPNGFGTKDPSIQIVAPSEKPDSLDDDYLLKCALRGDNGSGLSSLLSRFTYNIFGQGTLDSDPRLREFGVRSVTCCHAGEDIEEQKSFRMQVWDQLPVKMNDKKWYIRGASVLVLSYDLSLPYDESRGSQVISEYKDNLWQLSSNIITILVGTKMDTLVGDPHAKEKLEAMKKLADENKFAYCITSAKTGFGMEKLEKLFLLPYENLLKTPSNVAASSS